MNPETIKFITQNLTPEQAAYVTGIKSTLNDTMALPSAQDDIIYITKLLAFKNKFIALHWAAITMSYHKALDDFQNIMEEYIDNVAENIQSIIGQFNGSDITKLELPLENDPLEVINELKETVSNWVKLHEDNMEYEGCRNSTSQFLENIHKYIYLFRLCKTSKD